MQEADIQLAEGHYRQALGNILPDASVEASELVQDSANTAAAGGTVDNTFTKRSRPAVAVTLTQPLFQGFREFHALRRSRAEREKNQLLWQRAQQLLFGDVAQAYYAVLQSEQELRIQESIVATLRTRLDELQERIKLGKSRLSEFLTTEAELAFSRAAIEQTRGVVQANRSLLAFLIGYPAPARLADGTLPKAQPTLRDWMTTATARPDIYASRAGTRMAHEKVKYTQGALYPKLGVTGNYYPYRTGFQQDIRWDVNFTLSVPLYSGVTYGDIKTAKVELAQARLAEQLAERQALLEVEQAYHQFTAARAQTAALYIAEEKARANFEALTEEYRLNRVNNLEALDGLRQWHSKRIEANRARYQAKLAYHTLEIASNQLEAMDPSR